MKINKTCEQKINQCYEEYALWWNHPETNRQPEDLRICGTFMFSDVVFLCVKQNKPLETVYAILELLGFEREEV